MHQDSTPYITLRHHGRAFAVSVDQVASIDHAAQPVAFWRVDTPDHPPYLGPRVRGDETPSFFTELVETAWWATKRVGVG